MIFLLFILFVAVPILETLILIKVGSVVGAWYTIALVIFSGMIGAYAVKTQGRQVLRKLENQFATNIEASGLFIHALLIFIGGILMIAPGFITDLLGMSFIIPITRKVHIKWLALLLKKGVKMGKFHFYSARGGENFSGKNDNFSSSESFQKKSSLNKNADVIDISTYRNKN